MIKIARFIIWIYSKFTKKEIEQIITGLTDVINNRNPEVKPKDDFKEQHPNYRNFYVDPLSPLTKRPEPKAAEPTKDYKILLQEYQDKHGNPLFPVKHRDDSLKASEKILCPNCNAPYTYLYYNDGKKKTQLLCKICKHLFQLSRRFRKNPKTKYYCPYCGNSLFKWKELKNVTIYKCPNDKCQRRSQSLSKLNAKERLLQKLSPSHFKLCYQYREYHFQSTDYQHSAPLEPKLNISKIHNSQDVLCLVLAFYVSLALSARKTALALKLIFNIHLSYQTVLNYAETAAFYCHAFNLQHKGSIDDISVGDEAYIKIMGKHFYVFFFISSKNHKISAYHVADNRGVLPAISAISEALKTSSPNQQPILIFDGNPSYPAAIHFLNLSNDNSNILFHKVIGLQNLDSESEKFRPFKQIIERLNRTYKHHINHSNGFSSFNGAVALTTLFVTYYNFLRPHMSLKYRTPVHLPQLGEIHTLQAKWAKIISLASS